MHKIPKENNLNIPRKTQSKNNYNKISLAHPMNRFHNQLKTKFFEANKT